MNRKSERVLSFLTAFACAAALSVGAVFSVATAFAVPVEGGKLAAALVLLSAAFAFLCGQRRGWIGLLVLTLAAAAVGYHDRLQLFQSSSVAIEAVTGFYASAFDALQTVTLLADTDGATGTAFFVVIGALLSLIAAWTVRGQTALWLTLIMGLLPLVLCLVILESVPAPWAALLVVGTLALLLLTQQLRRRDEAAGASLAAMLAGPLALLVLLLCVLFPPSAYTRSEWSSSLAPKVSQVADKLSIFRLNETTGQVQFVSPFTPSTLGSRVWDNSVNKANLNRVGPQRKNGQHVMRVYSADEWTYYLRGCSLGVYEDNQWLAVDDSAYTDAPIPEDVFLYSTTLYGEPVDTVKVQIQTDMKSSVYYTPYPLTELPEDAQPIHDAYVKNPMQSTEYALGWGRGAGQSGGSAAADEAYRDFVYKTYLQLPEELEAFLNETYGSLDPMPPIELNVEKLLNGKYYGEVQTTGKTYSLDTPRVPEGEDFVTWFLRESDTGYCVHFATAATMLMRYFGIPARYVTGYLVEAKAGEWTDVTQDNAHAWVEYYRDGFGWMMFDPTPAAGDGPSTADEAPPQDEPDETQPEEPVEKQTDQPPEKTEIEEQNEEETSNNTINHENNKNNIQENKARGERPGIVTALLTVLWCLLAVAAVVFLWRIAVLSARTANLNRGSVNRRAVHYYRHIAMLARLNKQQIPEELDRLAQKARFSQHALSEEELEQFVAYADTLTRSLLENAPAVRRCMYRLIYVLQ